MKAMLEHHNFLIAMTVLTSLTILLKCLCAIKYQILIKEVEQISSSKNPILRSMITKYESCFKLQHPIKNTESFIKVYQENFRLFGIPLKNLENFDLFCVFFVTFIVLLSIMGGIYYKLPAKWIIVQGMTFSTFLAFLGISEFLFQTRKKGELLTVHLIHYFDNTLYTKLFQKYIQKKKHTAYLQEYFEPLDQNAPAADNLFDERPAATLEKKLAPDMRELIESLVEETYAENSSPQPKDTKNSADKYHLVEEIIKEYL